MNCVTGAQRNVRGKTSDQSGSSSEQPLADAHQIPEPVFDMASENIDQLGTLRQRQRPLADMALEDTDHLD